MTTDEFEALLEGAEETDTLEFKGAMTWAAPDLAKDILALTNTVDGGRIVIGIEDQTLARQGLNEEQVQSYNADIMRDQMRGYADPSVTFSVEMVTDRQGLSFVVITVATFPDIPVLCARDGNGLIRGAIYYRSRSGRPASAQVSNSTDMRLIIETGVARRLRNLRRVGIIPEPPVDDRYDAELGELQ